MVTAFHFPYAKNIIQYNIDVLHGYGHHKTEGFKALNYRDDLTEGYNITPNFFIRGMIYPDKLTYAEDLLESKGKDATIVNKHFDNRLFDRDTLILNEYNINFLYVLSAYVLATESNVEKEHLRQAFRKDLIETLNSHYKFYIVTPTEDIKKYVDKHFRDYAGKMYRWSENKILIAFEKGTVPKNIPEDAVWEDWEIGKS